jgi:hypothetical protein
MAIRIRLRSYSALWFAAHFHPFDLHRVLHQERAFAAARCVSHFRFTGRPFFCGLLFRWSLLAGVLLLRRGFRGAFFFGAFFLGGLRFLAGLLFLGRFFFGAAFRAAVSFFFLAFFFLRGLDALRVGFFFFFFLVAAIRFASLLARLMHVHVHCSHCQSRGEDKGVLDDHRFVVHRD